MRLRDKFCLVYKWSNFESPTTTFSIKIVTNFTSVWQFNTEVCMAVKGLKYQSSNLLRELAWSNHILLLLTSSVANFFHGQNYMAQSKSVLSL